MTQNYSKKNPQDQSKGYTNSLIPRRKLKSNFSTYTINTTYDIWPRYSFYWLAVVKLPCIHPSLHWKGHLFPVTKKLGRREGGSGSGNNEHVDKCKEGVELVEGKNFVCLSIRQRRRTNGILQHQWRKHYNSHVV